MPSKNCPQCGYEVRAGAFKCGLCGTPFVEGSAPSLASTTVTRSRELMGDDPIPIRRDFAAEIGSNQFKSAILLAVSIALLAAVGLSLGYWYHFPRVGVVLGLTLGAVLMIWSYFNGDSAILNLSCARMADAVQDRQIINLVDEMRIAAGIPMPKVMIIDTQAPNAFATGRDPEHATVAVTAGLVSMLNREELQGVIAHEMSHVRNFDTRYMMLVAAIVGAIIIISDTTTRSWWWGGGRRSRDSDRSGGGVIAILGLVLIVLAPIFATLLQMAVSRKREFLADASAVELTRNPGALASALEKIDRHIDRNALGSALELDGPFSRETLPGASKATQHLYIANPLKTFGMKSSALFSTHPPMEARVRLLRAMA